MKAIAQEGETGCGLACVAMLAGESFQLRLRPLADHYTRESPT